MKKSLLAIISVIIMVATSSLFFSCSKDDDGTTQKETPVTYVDVPFYTAVLDSQMLFVDHKYEFIVDGVAKTVSIDSMTIENNIPSKFQELLKEMVGGSRKSRVHWLKYSCYKKTFHVKKGSTVTFVKTNHSAKSNLPEGFEVIDYLNAYYFDLRDVSVHSEVMVDSLQPFLNAFNKHQKNISVIAK